MWMDVADVEVEAGGQAVNVSFDRGVSDDGAELGVRRIRVYEPETGERGPKDEAEEGALRAAIARWIAAHPPRPEWFHDERGYYER